MVAISGIAISSVCFGAAAAHAQGAFALRNSRKEKADTIDATTFADSKEEYIHTRLPRILPDS